MTDSDNQRLDRIETDLTQISSQLNTLTNQLNQFQIRYDERSQAYDSKLDAYQKASQQVVNIAFGLLATATLAIIIPAVLAR